MSEFSEKIKMIEVSALEALLSAFKVLDIKSDIDFEIARKFCFVDHGPGLISREWVEETNTQFSHISYCIIGLLFVKKSSYATKPFRAEIVDIILAYYEMKLSSLTT